MVSIDSQLARCSNLVDLTQFLNHLGAVEKVSFEGRKVLCKDGKRLNLNVLENKILKLYYKEILDDSKAVVEVYKRTTVAIYELQKITTGTNPSSQVFRKVFGRDDKVTQLERSCIDGVRGDANSLKTIKQNYNELAEEVNKLVEKNKKKPEESLRNSIETKLEALDHLNRFLGVEWTSRIFKGEEKVPIYSESVLILPEAPEKGELKGCENLSQLVSYLDTLVGQLTELTFHQDYFVKKSGQPIKYQDIENQILRFIHDENGRPVHLFFPIAHAAIYQLSVLKPMALRQPPKETEKALSTIRNHCVKEIQKDNNLQKVLWQEYQKLADAINDKVFSSKVMGEELKEDQTKTLFQSLMEIGRLAEMLGLLVTSAQKRGVAFFPIHVDWSDVETATKARQKYCHYALVLNRESSLNLLRSRLREIETLIRQDSYQKKGSFLNLKKRTALGLEFETLEKKLKDVPLKIPYQTLQSLRSVTLRLAKSLQVPLTSKQQKGVDALPVPGPILDSEKAYFKKSYRIPGVLRFFEYRVEQINDYIKFQKVKREKAKLEEKGLLGLWKDDQAMSRLRELNKTFLHLYQKNDRCDHHDYLLQLSLALYANEACEFLKLDSDQMKGLKEWPNPDIKLKQPTPKMIYRDLKELEPDGEKMAHAYRALPEKWQENFFKWMETSTKEEKI